MPPSHPRRSTNFHTHRCGLGAFSGQRFGKTPLHSEWLRHAPGSDNRAIAAPRWAQWALKWIQQPHWGITAVRVLPVPPHDFTICLHVVFEHGFGIDFSLIFDLIFVYLFFVDTFLVLTHAMQNPEFDDPYNELEWFDTSGKYVFRGLRIFTSLCIDIGSILEPARINFLCILTIDGLICF